MWRPFKAPMRWAPGVSLLLVLLTSGIMAFADGTNMRWDIVGVDASTKPPTIVAGGTDTASAVDGSIIIVTGSGTFVVGESDEVTGGGTWKTVASEGLRPRGAEPIR